MKHAILMLIAGGAVLAGSATWAEDAPGPAELPVQIPAAFDAALPDSALSEYRGGATITNINDLDASLYGNTALDTLTGGNLVTEGALAGMSGVSTVIQNSGNNVLIQNALILNLQVQ